MANIAKNIEKIINLDGNNKCADCFTEIDSDNGWASITFGTIICVECAGIHRGIAGNQIRSFLLDSSAWKNNKNVDFLTSIGGNNTANNNVWEHLIPSYYINPKIDKFNLKYLQSITSLRDLFIKTKYSRQLFIPLSVNEYYSKNPSINKMPCEAQQDLFYFLNQNTNKWNSGKKTHFLLIHSCFLSKYNNTKIKKSKSKHLLTLNLTKLKLIISTSSNDDQYDDDDDFGCDNIFEFKLINTENDQSDCVLRVRSDNFNIFIKFVHNIRKRISYYKMFHKLCLINYKSIHPSTLILNYNSFHKSFIFIGTGKLYGTQLSYFFILNNNLYSFNKSPINNKMNKKKNNSPNITAQYGWELQKIDFLNDLHGKNSRSGYKYCLLLIEPERIVTIKFDSEVNLMSFFMKIKKELINIKGNYLVDFKNENAVIIDEQTDNNIKSPRNNHNKIANFDNVKSKSLNNVRPKEILQILAKIQKDKQQQQQDQKDQKEDEIVLNLPPNIGNNDDIDDKNGQNDDKNGQNDDKNAKIDDKNGQIDDKNAKNDDKNGQNDDDKMDDIHNKMVEMKQNNNIPPALSSSASLHDGNQAVSSPVPSLFQSKSFNNVNDNGLQQLDLADAAALPDDDDDDDNDNFSNNNDEKDVILNDNPGGDPGGNQGGDPGGDLGGDPGGPGTGVNSWKCANCTYSNPMSIKQCEMCGKTPINASQPQLQPQSQSQSNAQNPPKLAYQYRQKSAPVMSDFNNNNNNNNNGNSNYMQYQQMMYHCNEFQRLFQQQQFAHNFTPLQLQNIQFMSNFHYQQYTMLYEQQQQSQSPLLQPQQQPQQAQPQPPQFKQQQSMFMPNTSSMYQQQAPMQSQYSLPQQHQPQPQPQPKAVNNNKKPGFQMQYIKLERFFVMNDDQKIELTTNINAIQQSLSQKANISVVASINCFKLKIPSNIPLPQRKEYWRDILKIIRNSIGMSLEHIL